MSEGAEHLLDVDDLRLELDDEERRARPGCRLGHARPRSQRKPREPTPSLGSAPYTWPRARRARHVSHRVGDRGPRLATAAPHRPGSPAPRRSAAAGQASIPRSGLVRPWTGQPARLPPCERRPPVASPGGSGPHGKRARGAKTSAEDARCPFIRPCRPLIVQTAVCPGRWILTRPVISTRLGPGGANLAG